MSERFDVFDALAKSFRQADLFGFRQADLFGFRQADLFGFFGSFGSREPLPVYQAILLEGAAGNAGQRFDFYFAAEALPYALNWLITISRHTLSVRHKKPRKLY
ncbi:MAG: hypothetical protein WBW33_07370 [Bryobacteraceae bacterium]